MRVGGVSSRPSTTSLTATAVFDALDLPVSLFAEDGTYRYINAPGLALLGKREDELVGRLYLDLFPELADHPFHAAFKRVASGQADIERLECFYPPMGLWSSQRIHRAEGHVIVLWENITARKHTEQLLEEAVARAAESERLFRTMIE